MMVAREAPWWNRTHRPPPAMEGSATELRAQKKPLGERDSIDIPKGGDAKTTLVQGLNREALP